MQSIYLMETYAYGMKKDQVCKEEDIKSNSIIEQYRNV